MAHTRWVKDMVKLGEEYGFVLVRKSNHLIFRHANGKQVVVPITNGDWRTRRNTESYFRQCGGTDD